MGDHGLRDHVRRLPAARRPRWPTCSAGGGSSWSASSCSRSPRSSAGSPVRASVLIARARGAGPRRGDHLAGRALDHHDDVRRGRGAQQGARDLGRDRRLRRRGRRARRRDADEVPRLGVDLLRQRARRRAGAPAGAALRPREPVGARAPPLRRCGAITVTAGLALLVYAISKAPDDGWGSARTILLLLGLAVALLVGVRRRSSRGRRSR